MESLFIYYLLFIIYERGVTWFYKTETKKNSGIASPFTQIGKLTYTQIIQ